MGRPYRGTESMIAKAVRELHNTGEATMDRARYRRILLAICETKQQALDLNKSLVSAGCITSAVRIMDPVHERARRLP